MRIADGLHRIGNEIVACYLVEDTSGLTLVDAGLPGQWRELAAELDAMGREVSDIRAVVLTHGDEDHIGFAERLRRDHDIPVLVHTADAGRARGEGKPSTPWGSWRLGPALRFLGYAARRGGLRTAPLTEVATFEAGEVLDAPGAPRVIGMPGHSPGSVALHFPRARAVMVGDALTTRHVLTGAEGPAPAPFTDAPAQAASSLDALAGLDVNWVLPGHGAPWRSGVDELIRRYRAGS
ncbi:MBL fold metallo-hydrolase [Demequina lignilytica]|uniref:MBL fold metallo-hydrolase n=1 Tax=Demequina lignilytica TaxID=3051663 RepID=A0AB35MH66_9MICO|nr:MBL fold metallo-hydrolase [Demequina sp. SYSU T0a273]MDN4483129.1 MBL fold metallo-hydrolase [Demequina sp. SYSU T0a273]